MIIGFWKRLISDIIDGFILWILGALLVGILRKYFEYMGDFAPLIGLVIIFIYYGTLQSKILKGQSLAKNLLGIQVIKNDGRFLSLKESYIRYIPLAILSYNHMLYFNLIKAFPFLKNSWFSFLFTSCIAILGFGFILCLPFHPLKKGPHDLLVDSLVVKEDNFNSDNFPIENPKSAKKAYIIWTISSILFIIFNYFSFFYQSPPIKETIDLTSIKNEIINKTNLKRIEIKVTKFNSDIGKISMLETILFFPHKQFKKKKIVKNICQKTANIIIKNYPDITNYEKFNIIAYTGVNIGIASHQTNKIYTYNNQGELISE